MARPKLDEVATLGLRSDKRLWINILGVEWVQRGVGPDEAGPVGEGAAPDFVQLLLDGAV
jgi:hypothetical protein